MDTIGNRITKARMRLGLNQKELCQRTGIKESTLSRYENCEREPKASTIITLAEVLDVSFDYLLGASDNMESFRKKTSHPHEKEITKIIQNAEENLSNEGLMHHGKPISKEDIDKLLTAIKVGVAMIDIKK